METFENKVVVVYRQPFLKFSIVGIGKGWPLHKL